MEKMTIDEEFELRAKTVQNLLDLVEDLKGSIAFFIHKCNFAFQNELADQNVFYNFLDIVNNEIANIIHQCEPATFMVNLCLLPIGERLDVDSLEESIQRVIILLNKDSDLRESSNFDEYCDLTLELIQNLLVFQTCNYMSVNDVRATFNELLNRYKEEHDAALRYYIEDCCSPEEDKVALRREYKGLIAVDSWNIHGRDIQKTIKDLSKKEAKEKDLLPLFEYIAKYDLLSTLEIDSSRKAQTIINGDVKIKNIENVDTIGNR